MKTSINHVERRYFCILKIRIEMRQISFFLLFLFCIVFSTSAQSQNNSNDQIKALIAKKRAYNKKYGFGYRIQLYYGRETEAREIETKFKAAYPEVFSKLTYEQPYWKVQVGNYRTKLEADKAMRSFSKEFSSLIIIPLGK